MFGSAEKSTAVTSSEMVPAPKEDACSYMSMDNSKPLVERV